jgi:hypothetical protein
MAEVRTTTIYWDKTGPMLGYQTDGVLVIRDLNPEATIFWRISRLQVICIAWRCLVAAVKL